MKTFLILYFSVNCFIAGFAVGYRDAESYAQLSSKMTKARFFIFIPTLIMFGSVAVALALLAKLIRDALEYLDGIFQLAFLFDFYLRRKYYNMDEETLNRLNKYYESIKENKKLRHKIFRRCVRLVNERNKFIYVPKEQNQNK
ncbi:MAG: hypothetical protein [Podoviridae sp. ctrTa16]|nr:MAG: hypothetical protein [Podoviridae sp. ctrTa16]